MSLTRKQVNLYDFLTNLSLIRSCNDNEYKETIESLIDELSNEPRRVEYLTRLLSEFRGFSTDLSKHIMVTRGDIKREMEKHEKEQPLEMEEVLDITTSSTILGVSRQTMYNLVKDKKIRTIRKSKGKQVISRKELERYQKENFLK
ncbi:MAG: helix-turn-helix domain-containing protein [Bacteroidales bacterium]|jgi:hypothetical protein